MEDAVPANPKMETPTNKVKTARNTRGLLWLAVTLDDVVVIAPFGFTAVVFIPDSSPLRRGSGCVASAEVNLRASAFVLACHSGWECVMVRERGRAV